MGAVARWAGERGRPLVVTRDEELLDDLLRLAFAGGIEVSVAVDAVAAEDAWASAPLVVVGGDLAGEVAHRGLPRRMDVLLVGDRDRCDDRALWSWAPALHADHVALLPEAQGWLVSRFAEHGPAGGPLVTPRGATVAVVPGSRGAASGELAAALAVTAHRQGWSVLLLGAGASDLAPSVVEPDDGLAVIRLERGGEPGVPADAMAAALRAGRAARDLVVIDLPYGIDEASLLALTCADRGHLVVVSEVRACAAAARVAAAARRHCPALALVVRSTRPLGLRPLEVGQALDLPVVGVVPPDVPPGRGGRSVGPGRAEHEGPLTRISRNLLADLDLRPRPAAWTRLDGTGGVQR